MSAAVSGRSRHADCDYYLPNGRRTNNSGNTIRIATYSKKGHLMADLKDKVANTGQAMADPVKNPGNEPAEAKGCAVEKPGATAKEGCGTGQANIKERMDVIASCGKKVGVVDHVDGGTIKLTKNDSPDGQHHFIPTGWVDHVDSHVHLKKNSVETEQGWKADAASCKACGA